MPKVSKQSAKRKRTSVKSVIDRIEPIGFDSDGIKISLYGRSGSGKTTLWSTFPKPILAVIVSGGAKSGELRSIGKEHRKGIKQIKLKSSDELGEVVEYAQDNGIATLVLDHATGLQDMILKELLGIEELPVQKSWGMASRQEYGQCAMQMKERLRSLIDLDCNVVIIAQEREFNTDNEGGEDSLLMPYVSSALTPSVVGWLNPACDYICQTFIRGKTVTKKTKIGKKVVTRQVRVRGVDYCLRTAPDPVFVTKFRLPKGVKLPDVIVDPGFDKLNNLINQG